MWHLAADCSYILAVGYVILEPGAFVFIWGCLEGTITGLPHTVVIVTGWEAVCPITYVSQRFNGICLLKQRKSIVMYILSAGQMAEQARAPAAIPENHI